MRFTFMVEIMYVFCVTCSTYFVSLVASDDDLRFPRLTREVNIKYNDGGPRSKFNDMIIFIVQNQKLPIAISRCVNVDFTT